MANKRNSAVLACALLLAVLLISFWRSSDTGSVSLKMAASSAPSDATLTVPERADAPPPPPPPAKATATKAAPGAANPRPITDAPHFSTMLEYRAEQAARPLPPESPVPPPAGRTPENEVQRIQGTVRRYRAAFGQNPVGSNPEITRTLAGKNPSGAKFLDPSAITLNDKGEMLDDWGVPYFFHPVSGSIMEIRSAGPDGRLFTPDDVVR
jgi:hypothetical protein